MTWRRLVCWSGGVVVVLLAGVLVGHLLVARATEGCRDGTCPWPQWHPYYWYFECWRDPCPVLTENASSCVQVR